jgi:nicotinate-nucleotide adenylyltransferase
MHATGEPERRVALYGGSFNPPHLAHLLVSLAILEARPVNEIWLVPTYAHAFGKMLAPFDLRVDWCRTLVEPLGSRASVCQIECELGGESRTIDTMNALVRRHPNLEFSLVMGSDIRTERNEWKRFDELEARFDIHWIGRVGHQTSESDIIIMPDISSSTIRLRLSQNLPVDNLVPSRVLSAIKNSGYKWV